MRRNYDYYNNPYGGGSSNSSIDEYLERVTRLQRMPSVATDIPEPPNAGLRTYPQKRNDYDRRNRRVKFQNQEPETHERVHIVEHEKVTEIGRDGKREVYEEDETIDVEADGFIQQKHKNFDLAKWDTMKAY